MFEKAKIRIAAVLLVLMMVLGTMPFMALAASNVFITIQAANPEAIGQLSVRMSVYCGILLSG